MSTWLSFRYVWFLKQFQDEVRKDCKIKLVDLEAKELC